MSNLPEEIDQTIILKKPINVSLLIELINFLKEKNYEIKHQKKGEFVILNLYKK